LKVLFDEDVPAKLLRSLPRHEIHTVVTMQWGGIKNGALLELVEREGFNVFLTGDKNMAHQQQLEGRAFAVLVMSAINWPFVKPHLHKESLARIRHLRLHLAQFMGHVFGKRREFR
jgi:predicted nuclease of predicted toxin-antitoxin system